MGIQRYDHVRLNKRCDSLFLTEGDTGQAMTEVLEDGYIAVAFDGEFQDCHDCEGYVKSGHGWFVKAEDLDILHTTGKEVEQ